MNTREENGSVDKVIVAYKNEGETPLECLERIRKERGIASGVPMSYAGRLDPMAEGVLPLIVGKEANQDAFKKQFLGLPKTYYTEILLGIETDTHDILGIPKSASQNEATPFTQIIHTIQKTIEIGTPCLQPYPAYSSKTVDGKALFAHARAGNDLRQKIPTHEVVIHSYEILTDSTRTISSQDLLGDIERRIAKVTGDFRQKTIIKAWKKLLSGKPQNQTLFTLISLRLSVSSGFYVRVFAHEIGKNIGCGALAYRIVRERVGEFS